MYDFLDRPVTALDHGGRFLIWAIRTWVKSATDKICPAGRLAPAFSSWRMLPGLPPFLSVMALFNLPTPCEIKSARSNFSFCDLRCNRISEHEALLMSLVCSLRDGRPERLQGTLALVVDDERIGDLIGSLSSLGRAMAEAGIYPDRPGLDTLDHTSPRQLRPRA